MEIIYAFLLGFAIATATLSVRNWLLRLSAVAFLISLIIVHYLSKTEIYIPENMQVMTQAGFWGSQKVLSAVMGAGVGAGLCLIAEHDPSGWMPTRLLRVLSAGRSSRTGPATAALMGTSTQNFQGAQLDMRMITTVHLSAYIFGGLTRRLVSGIETSLRPTAAQRGPVESLIAQSFHKRPPLRRIIKRYRESGAGHDETLRLFIMLCTIASASLDYNPSVMRSLIVVGKALGLNRTQLQSCFERAGLV